MIRLDSESKAFNSAVIDVGLDRTTYRKYRGLTNFLMVRESLICNLDDSVLLDYTSHGGICLRCFESSSGAASDYFILLKHDEDVRCNVDDLIIALDWCVDNGVSLISLSMGTTQYSDVGKFSDVMERINLKGVCLIAGASNDRHLSYPACFDECIGVCYEYTNEHISNSFEYISNPFDGIDIVLNPSAFSSESINSTSVATAYFSGLITKAITSGETRTCDVRNFIANNAERIADCLLYSYTLNAIALDVSEDIIVVGIDNLSSNMSALEFCRELQKVFLCDDYHCVIILPECGIKNACDLTRHEFVQPMNSGCSYTEYIGLIKKLCKPNLVLVSLEEGVTDYDVVISNEVADGNYGYEVLVACCDGISSAEVFEQVVNYFDSENNN